MMGSYRGDIIEGTKWAALVTRFEYTRRLPFIGFEVRVVRVIDKVDWE